MLVIIEEGAFLCVACGIYDCDLIGSGKGRYFVHHYVYENHEGNSEFGRDNKLL